MLIIGSNEEGTMTDITLFADRADVGGMPNGTLEVDLEGIDMSQLVQEVGSDVLLSEIPREEIEEYLKELDNED